MSRDFTIRRLCTRRDVNQTHAFLLALQEEGSSSLDWLRYPESLREYLMEYRSGRRSRVYIARCARDMHVNDDLDLMFCGSVAGVMVAHRPLQLNRGVPSVTYWSATEPSIVLHEDVIHECLYERLMQVTAPGHNWEVARRIQMGHLELL